MINVFLKSLVAFKKADWFVKTKTEQLGTLSADAAG
jgi:hypothetical protein